MPNLDIDPEVYELHFFPLDPPTFTEYLDLVQSRSGRGVIVLLAPISPRITIEKGVGHITDAQCDCACEISEGW